MGIKQEKIIKKSLDKKSIKDKHINQKHMRNKKVVRLTESRLRNIVKQSVNSILKEHVDQGEFALEIVQKLEEASDLMNDYMMTQEYGHQFEEASELIKRAISLLKKHKNNILWGLDIEDYEDDDTLGRFK